ncbi:MAG: radical SAM protein [Anaerolineae bacterium]
MAEESLDSGNILISVRENSISISIDAVPNFSFDRKGRLIGAYIDGHNFRRTMDNRVIEKWAHRERGFKERIRRELSAEEKRRFLDELHATLSRVYREVEAGKFQMVPSARAEPASLAEVQSWLERILAWDYARLEKERELFLKVYKPVTILPPDQYLALVLQATEGCSYNRCTFCQFYRDRKFRIKPEEEFRAHIKAVKELFGEALGLRKSIFLADANALVIAQKLLLPIFEAINEEFAIIPAHLKGPALAQWKREHPLFFQGIYSFISAFDALRKSEDDFHVLGRQGLRRVYIGLETGDDDLLRFLNKPGSAADVCRAVSTIKGGGIKVGVIIMTGIGGDRYAEGHVKNSIEAVNAMGLGEGDIVYFSRFVDHPGSEYARRAAAQGIRPLTREEVQEQTRRIKAGFIFPDPARPPKVSVYDIREFIY